MKQKSNEEILAEIDQRIDEAAALWKEYARRPAGFADFSSRLSSKNVIIRPSQR